ncbi:MAK10-like protein [Tanacetum coccineum]|uniref:MAK10-like protein n=1 Tax=Tanacetum coccineum TaxID=301880 RepID=A0ABQ5BXZ5_9ASTR
MGDDDILSHSRRITSNLANEGYRNTIEHPRKGNNVHFWVVLYLTATIPVVQKRSCSFHGLRSEDPNQHLKDFLKLVDSLDLDGENREETRLRLFLFSLRDQASNWLECLPAGSITTWEDLTTRFLAQFFPPGRTAKLSNIPPYGIDLWLKVQIFYDHVNPVIRRTIDQSASGKLRDLNVEESWALLEGLTLYNNESWNDPRDFAKPVKAIALPQDVLSTSNRHLIELENQVQSLMEAHLAPTQPILSEQKSIHHVSSHTNEAGGKWYTFKPEQNNLGDTYNPSWRSHPNLRLLEEAGHIFGLADGTKSYPVRIVKAIEVHIGKLKLLNNFYVIDMKKDPDTPLLVWERHSSTANAVIDYRMAKIAVREGITRSVFGVKGVDLGEEESPYWTTLGKRESYKPRPLLDGIGTRTPYYARKDFLDCHLPGEWEIARDAELNPFKDTLVFRRMVEFLGAIPINLKSNMWESEDLIKKLINWDKPPKNGDGAWHPMI